MPSIEITFRNKLSPDQRQELITKLRELIPEPIVSIDYDEVDYFEHRIYKDISKTVKRTWIPYRVKKCLK